MELHEYPRPDNDTGIGLHWVAGYATAVGIARIREYWIPQLKSLGVKWIKIYNHDGAIDFAELLLAEGIMPVVRIFQPTPNPSRLGLKEIVLVEALIRAGVHYFEFNHEPDRDESWRGGRVPADGLDLVVENTIANLEVILERGGMPAVPAVANGSRWDLVGKIVQKGRRDLLDGPVWQALHNYSLNRPLDYPYDIGNQEGAAYTPRFYRAVAEEEWGENAWRGRTLVEVNRLRLNRSNPGATIADDHACWLGYEHFDQLNQRHLGRSIPLLSTECGYLVGEDVDPRYPATTPDLHMAQTLEACRVMMGTSQRFEPAPDYYFCTAFRLLANAKLGSSSSWWEGQAWYSDRWPSGMLPIAHALRAEKKAVRRWQGAGQVGELAAVHGLVLNAAPEQAIVLSKSGRDLKRAVLDANHRYRFDDLMPGRYTIRVEGHEAAHTVELSPARDVVVVNFDLQTAAEGSSNSIVAGTVRGGAGSIVMLLRASDGEEIVSLAREDGSFRFVDLPAGLYNARVHPAGSRHDNIVLDGSNRVEFELTTVGWGHTVQTIDPGSHGLATAIHCRVQGHDDISVHVVGGEWESDVALTGSAPALGPHMCAFTKVEPGSYLVVVDDLPLPDGTTAAAKARVRVDGKHIPLVDFVFSEPQASAGATESILTGHVIGGFVAGVPLEIVLIDDAGSRRIAAVNETGEFRFEGLPGGLYTVEIVGHEETSSRPDVALDGQSETRVELLLSPRGEDSAAARSAVAGYVPDAVGATAQLTDTVGNVYTRLVGEDGRFHFDRLPAEIYSLTVTGGYVQQPLVLDGTAAVEVLFSPLTLAWKADVSQAGSMPGFSALRVEVEGMADYPVSVWQEEGDERIEQTGNDSELGDYVAEFKPLAPGQYMVRPHEIDTVVTVDLTGLEALWVTFRRRQEPVTPHLVRPLLPADPAEPTDRTHYLYLAEEPLDDLPLESLLRYAAAMRPLIGSDVEQASAAQHITVVGQLSATEHVALTARGASLDYFRNGEMKNGTATIEDA